MPRLEILLLIALLLRPFAARASEAPSVSEDAWIPRIATQARGACSDGEEWSFGPSVPAEWTETLSADRESQEEWIRVFAWAQGAKQSASSEEAKALAEYWGWRSIHALGFPQLAFRGMSAMLAAKAPAESLGIRYAALSCMWRIHSRLTSIAIPPSVVQVASELSKLALPPAQKRLLLDAVASYARRKIAETPAGSRLQLDGELAVLKGSQSHDALVRAMLAAKSGANADLIRYAKAFLEKPEASPSLVDPVRLQLARAHYHAGEYDAAILALERIGNESNSFAQSLMEIAWSRLRKGGFREASSTAHNLIMGKLSKTFSPEAPTVVAVALFENCHYPQALKAIRYFRRAYQPSYEWLYQWRTKPGLPAHKDLYGQVASYLRRSSKVPDAIASEWVRSPVFISYQQEINEVLDQKGRLLGLIRRLDREIAGAQDKASRKSRLALRTVIAQYARQVPALQAQLIQKVNSDLADRNRQMLALLADVAENSQLIEAEIFNAAGEDMIAANIQARGGKQPAAAAPSQAKEMDKESRAVLNWGRFPAGDEEDAEVWVDEIGFLRSDVTNKCRNR